MTRLPILLACLFLALFAAACGDDDEQETAATPEPTAEATAEPAGEIDPSAISTDLSEKPTVDKPEGSPPTQLVTEDIVEGKGKTAKAGDIVSMQYIGNAWSTGEEFDASWNRGEPLNFRLGARQVIPGWEQGVMGMRVGGRRQLVIPPNLAYGDRGAGGVIKPGETLVFVVDLVGVN